MTAAIREKSGRYYIMVDWRQDGKRKQKWIKTPYMVGTNCKRKLEQLRLEVLSEYKPLTELVDGEVLFSDYLITWIEETKHHLALSTYNSYRQALEREICPYFAAQKIKLNELKPYHIQKFYNDRMEINGNSANTVLHFHAYIHSALNYAVRTERLHRNPADNVVLPRKEKHIANYYTLDELNNLISFVKGKPLEPVVLLASWFGLRRGEIIGLKWDCIDFQNKTISIVGVMKDRGDPDKKREMYYCPTPKTSSSIRLLPMPQAAIDYLSALKAKQDERKATDEYYNHDWDDFVCVWDNGNILTLDYVSHMFPRLSEKAGLRRLKLHELRHTNISLLLESGANMRELVDWAGHSNYSTTADIYSHIQYSAKKKLASMLENIIVPQ